MKCLKNIIKMLCAILLVVLCLSDIVFAAEIQKENSYHNIKFYEKRDEPHGGDKKSFTAEEAAFISHAPVLRVGYESTGKPMEYYDEESQSAKGISIDLLKKISAYSGLRFEYVKTDSMEQALQMINNGEVQMVSGLIACAQFAEVYRLEPTDPLIGNSLVFITKQGRNIEHTQATAAIPEKWVGICHHMEENYPDIRIESYSNIEDCLAAVNNGQADLSVLNAYSAEKALKAYRNRELIANSMSKGNIAICLGTALDADPLLHTVLNKSIASIREQDRKQIVYQHTISLPYEPSYFELIQYNIPALFIGIMIFVAILFLFSLHSRKKLNDLAFRDPLTGEMNLNKFKLEAQKRMNRADKANALMVVDIDKFKSINDLYGYEFGDQLLVLVAKALRKSLIPGAIICRGQADKFYLFFEFISIEWFIKQFEILSDNVKNEVIQNMPACNIILSSGVCIIQPQMGNIISMIDRANIASKQVKTYHESCFAFYDQSMYDRLNQTRMIENNMSASLKNEEFVMYLQPKIDLITKRISGMEALVRWQHPEKGLIQPNDFIPLFEENGFIVNLDFYMLEQACKLLERWKQEGRKLLSISVNLSRRHLFHADTVRLLHSIVSKYDVEPSLIEVELTESAFDNCDVQAINILFEALHDKGFTVSVDDFGAGYSSLSLLKDLPIDVLKIDKSFFDCHRNSETDKTEILLESVISLSRKLNIKTVSEGVETQQHVDLLVKLGCDLVQGYYFAKPMPVPQLETLLDSEDLFYGLDKCGNHSEGTSE